MIEPKKESTVSLHQKVVKDFSVLRTKRKKNIGEAIDILAKLTNYRFSYIVRILDSKNCLR